MESKINWIIRILKERIHSNIEIKIYDKFYKIFISNDNNKFFIRCPIEKSLYSTNLKNSFLKKIILINSK